MSTWIKLRKYEMNTISAVKSRWCEIYIILKGILYTCKQITLKETKKKITFKICWVRRTKSYGYISVFFYVDL